MEDFNKYLELKIEEINSHLEIAVFLKCKSSSISLFEQVIDLLNTILDVVTNNKLKTNYLNQFKIDIESIAGFFPIKAPNNNIEHVRTIVAGSQSIINEIENNYKNIEYSYNRLSFNLNFFKMVGFFENNLVAIGANGSGKTTLSNKFRFFSNRNNIVIPAQKILYIPRFTSISNHGITLQNLEKVQDNDKTYKTHNQKGLMEREFQVILESLISDHLKSCFTYKENAKELISNNELITNPPITNLDKTLQIWNSLIKHRELILTGGLNFFVQTENNKSYEAIGMSDGEKVILYLISQVLQAPKDGFIIVDEPEMFLHKTIIKKLWDMLENERRDCIFIYLTHDLDFAASRNSAKKLWIKSFIFPDYWEIEKIPQNNIPEILMLELLGSQKNILFCEGTGESIDANIYSILFPNYTITPVGSCFNVINHTKAFNKIPNININALGLIDADHHERKRIEKLKKDNVYSFNVAEVENLFLDEEFLKILAEQVLIDTTIINKIKVDIIKELKKEIELQVSNYISTKINYYFEESHVSKGNNLTQVNENFSNFITKVEIQKWYDLRKKKLEKIISENNYNEAIAIFNNKGLIQIVSKHFDIKHFVEKAIIFLNVNETAPKILLRYFPEELSRT